MWAIIFQLKIIKKKKFDEFPCLMPRRLYIQMNVQENKREQQKT